MAETGQVYQFNDVRALVSSADANTVFWNEVINRRGHDQVSFVQRKTPRWFFDKYTTPQ